MKCPICDIELNYERVENISFFRYLHYECPNANCLVTEVIIEMEVS